MKKIFYCLLAIGLLSLYQNCSKSNFDSGAQVSASSAEVLSLAKGDIRICPQLMCAAPPENCHYDVSPVSSVSIASSCPNNCGKLICKSPHVCPMMACVAPPPNCHYEGVPAKNADGCSIGCGAIVCDGSTPPPPPPPVRPPEPCPMISCRVPPPNCVYDQKPLLNSNRCPINCGNLVCQPIPDPKPPICPQILCVEPKPGCHYKEKSPLDANACETGCGQNLVCDPVVSPPTLPPVKKPILCPMYACYLPADGNCKYDGTPRLDANGCNIGCGNLICTDNSK